MAAFLEHASRLLWGVAVHRGSFPGPVHACKTGRRRVRRSGRVQAEQQDDAPDLSAFYVDPLQSSATRSNESSNGSKPERIFDPMGLKTWPRKADLFIMRTDGRSCSRETVKASSGCFSFAYPSTQQQMLVWKGRPKCVLVLKKLGEELQSEFLEVIHWLSDEEHVQVVVEPHEREALADQPLQERLASFQEKDLERLHLHIDFVVCLGGDGVLLHASALFKRAIPPVICFNLGSLGFLTNHSFSDFRRDLRDVIHGGEGLEECCMPGEEIRGVHITLRMRLLCEVCRSGEAQPEQSYEVMNGVVVDRGANPYLTKIECWEHGRLITKVQADGVMLATPTGSTAYSVAAGGSMVHPNVPAILFTPVCPHSLSFRPVILPDYAELQLKIPGDARSSAWVCFDGKQRQELLCGDSVRVRMSPNPVPTIDHLEQTSDWFDSLERCFGWNDRGADQKALTHSAMEARVQHPAEADVPL
jgi:NAD+ kinase